MAILRNTTVNDTGFLQLPVGTTGQRPSVSNGRLRFNSTTGKVEFYNSSIGNWVDISYLNVIATGGNSVYDVEVEGTTYRVHVFTTTGNSTFTVTQGGSVEYLIVAGGGGGGYHHGGGGGGGGYLTGYQTIGTQSYTIVVGNGGNGDSGGSSPFRSAPNGQNSSAFSLTSIGGGGGGGDSAGGAAGGSGGGGSNWIGNAGGAGTSGQGFAGASGGGSNDIGGGGGGAGGTPSILNRNGGPGLVSSISGIVFGMSGGGGAGGYFSPVGTATFGGGNGGLGPHESGTNGSPGTPNSGGGGGGAAAYLQGGGNGGSGIVIIRYPIRQKELITHVRKVSDSSLIMSFDFSSPNSYGGIGNFIFDSYSNSTEAILVNSPGVADFRTHRSSLTFNGSNQHINAGILELRRNFTLEMWARRNGDVDFSIFGQGPAATNQGLHIVYATSSRGMIYGMFGNDNDYQNNYRPAGNIYQHWVFTYDHSTFQKQFYANGILQTPGSSVQNQYAGTGQFNIGATFSGALAFANGNIAISNVYSKVLSPTEILNNYTTNRWRFGL